MENFEIDAIAFSALAPRSHSAWRKVRASPRYRSDTVVDAPQTGTWSAREFQRHSRTGLSVLPGSNASVHYERITGPCTIATVRGDYGFQRNGLNAAGAQLLALGKMFFDGAGNQVVRQSIDRNGNFVTIDQLGIYQVASDCTGTQSDSSGVFARMVVTHNGDEMLGMSLTPGNSVVTHYEREVR